ncbi:MAG: hypothetical protein PWR20_2090 [Bacteroidales bacterium]|jgi:hypothetical protein|nr:hypothetical protein [Bacteroidales bacterium]MDN5329282.1 hypothetical protein [Bacteroidales bacterium]
MYNQGELEKVPPFNFLNYVKKKNELHINIFTTCFSHIIWNY